MIQPGSRPLAPTVAGTQRGRLAAAPVHRGAACASCSLKSGCLARSLHGAELESFSSVARLKRKVRRTRALFCAGDALSAVYVVHSGSLKTVTVSRAGQQKITGFYLPGDFVGLDAIGDGAYFADAIALEDSDLCVLPIRELESLAIRVPALQRDLVRALSAEIARDHGLLLFGCMDAERRVLGLLTSLAQRYHRLGYARDALLLPMTRDEIASHLCLSPETVSRVISRLRRKGVLTVHQRHIGFANPAQLAAVADW